MAAKKAETNKKQRVPELDLSAINNPDDEVQEMIGRTLYDGDSEISKEDLDTYLNREREHANIFYALASKFGLSIY